MAVNDVYLRPDAGDGPNGVRLRPDAPDSAGGAAPNFQSGSVAADIRYSPRANQSGVMNVSAAGLLTVLSVVTATISVRPPTYVKYVQIPPPQLWVAPNLAVGMAAPAPGLLGKSAVEPVYSKRWAVQAELGPNLAVSMPAVVATQLLRAALIDPVYSRRSGMMPEQSPNLLFGTLGFRLFEQAEWPNPPPIKRAVPEVSPNLAVGMAPAAPVVLNIEPPIDPGYSKRWTAQFEQAPNLAAGMAAPVVGLLGEPLIEPVYSRRPLPLSEMAPNLAVAMPAAGLLGSELIEPVYSRRLLALVDLAPNLAFGMPPPAVTPALVYPPIAPQLALRYAPQIDYSPNLAFGMPPPAVVAPVDLNSGWSFHNAYDRHVIRCDKRKQLIDRQREAAKQVKDGLDRQIAQALLEKELGEERERQASSLARLVRKHEADLRAGIDAQRVIDALNAALERATVSSYLALQREIERFLEEEEMAVLMTLLLDD